MTQMPTSQLYRELRRSRSDRMLGGVCGGVARYFAIDPVAARVAFAVLAVITGGVAAIAYVLAWILMPEEPVPAYPAYPSQPPTAPPAG